MEDLSLFGSYTLSSRILNLYLYNGVYNCSEVPVGTTEITECILVLRNMYLSYRSYTCFTNTGLSVGTTELILILSIGGTRRYY